MPCKRQIYDHDYYTMCGGVCAYACMCVCAYMLDERLHYLVAIWHVSNHIFHVVLGRPDQSWPKHQSQIPRFHLHAGPR